MSLSDIFFPPKCVSCGQVITQSKESRVFCMPCLIRYYEEINSPCFFCGNSYVNCTCRPVRFMPDEFVYALPYDKDLNVCKSMILYYKNRKNKWLSYFVAKAILEKASRVCSLPRDSVVFLCRVLPKKSDRTKPIRRKNLLFRSGKGWV